MGEGSLTQLDPQGLQALRQAALEDLYVFAKGVLGYSLMAQSVHVPLCRALEDASRRDKMIVLPRSWFKTTLCSIAYPLWLAVRNPNVRILLVQNTYTNALAKLRSIQHHVEGNELFRVLFPEVLPDKSCVWKNDSLCLKRSGNFPESTFECAGIKTQVVSRHYDVIIEDDTVAPDLDEMGGENLVPAKDDIEQAIGFHKLTFPLFVNPQSAVSIVVGTRWFELDLISWIKANEPQYQVIERACREREGKPCVDGEVTFPERFNDEVLATIERKMGPYLFSCLYMNLPLHSKDMVFKPEWVSWYEEVPAGVVVTTTVDLAGDPETQKGSDNDRNVVMTTGKDLRTGRVYVIDYFAEKCNPGELLDALFSHVRKYKPVKVGIETVAYQSTLVYWARQRMARENVYFLIEPVRNNRTGKNLRIMGLQPVMASRFLAFRTWMKELVNELLVFPLGAHDDLSDALAMQLPMWQVSGASEEAALEQRQDPYSLEGALESIARRTHVGDRGMVFDVFEGSARIPHGFLSWAGTN